MRVCVRVCVCVHLPFTFTVNRHTIQLFANFKWLRLYSPCSLLAFPSFYTVPLHIQVHTQAICIHMYNAFCPCVYAYIHIYILLNKSMCCTCTCVNTCMHICMHVLYYMYVLLKSVYMYVFLTIMYKYTCIASPYPRISGFAYQYVYMFVCLCIVCVCPHFWPWE